jgi:putative ABC transport system permease protein
MNGTLLSHAVFARFARYKGKTALLTLAIAIGVLATVAITLFAEGAIRSFTRYARIVYPSDSVVVAGDEGGEIALADVETLRAAIPEIVDWDPLVRTGGRAIKNGDRDVRVGVQGYSERAEQVRRRSVKEGEFFTAADVASRARVALLGSTTVRELFGAQSPVGAEIFIDNLRFEVRGVLQDAGADLHGGDLDQAVWIPFTTALDLTKSDSLTSASLQLGEPALTETVGERIASTLRERHGLPEGFVDDFTVTTPRGIGDQVNGMAAMIGRFTTVVAATVFTVAALVVVGVMRATVKQRAAEIGLRRALGARRRDLRLQIVLEVLVVSLVASGLGLVTGWLLLEAFAPALLESTGVEVAPPSAGLVLASMAAAVATGLVGSVPAALKAARLDPVETLR